jgi:hypothetical protein
MDEDLRAQYFKLLMLPEKEPSRAHEAALERAHELRKFEIENYWKRSTYFWGFQLVAFGALALVAKDGKFHPPIVLLVSVLGALTALTGILTARGSKFWQANWEAHVDFLESAVEGNLHMTALVERQLEYSVSRVNERLLELLFLGWILAFAAAAAVLIWPGLLSLTAGEAASWQIGIPAFVMAAGAFRIIRGQKSNLRGRAYYRSSLKPVPASASEPKPAVRTGGAGTGNDGTTEVYDLAHADKKEE